MPVTLGPRPKTTRINAVCRSCSAFPALTPDQCPDAVACFRTGLQAQRRQEAAAVKRPDGRAVRKVIRYEEEPDGAVR